MQVFLEKKTAHFIAELTAQGGTPIYKLPVKEARQVLEGLQAAYPVEKLLVEMEDLSLPCGPQGKVSVRIVRPSNGNGKLPTVMYFHGGGWVLGSKETHDRLIREIAHGAQANIVFVNFNRSPESKYPTSVEEGYAATKYVSEHGKSLNLDSSRIAVAGDSVGGYMAAVIAILAKERNGPKIDYQLMFYPVTNADFNTRSYQEFADGPWLTRAAMEWFWNAYAPNPAVRRSHLVCPLHSTLQQLHDLPPALIITAENDVLRDEGEAYAHKLMQAGVEVATMRCLGTMHDFVMLNALSGTPAAKSAIALACSSLQKALAKQKSARQKRVA